MANEIVYIEPKETGNNLYAIRFDGAHHFVTDGSSSEEWGSDAHDADTYDVTITEAGTGGGCFVGHFDASSEISAGDYPVNIYRRAGANPDDADKRIGTAEMNWDGSAEITRSVIDTVVDAILNDTDELQADDIPGKISALQDFDPDNDTVARVTLTDTATALTGKTGFKLASDGLDSVSTTEPSGVASNFREMLVQVWRRFFKRVTMTDTALLNFKDDNSQATTQTMSDDGTTQEVGKAS